MQTIDYQAIKGAVIDMDGVVTKTMLVHSRAWKMMFDNYLKKKNLLENKRYPLMDIAKDYAPHIDGMSRNNGVKNFLSSRGIVIPEGNRNDEPGKETIWGLGNQKFEYFKNIIEAEGIETYPNAIQKIREWKSNGLKTVLISSSHTTELVLKKAHIEDLFDAIIDGEYSYHQKLRGKPSPDIYYAAAKQIETLPQECLVVEDSILGVAAAKRGRFKLVIGIDRQGKKEALLKFGANLVVSDMANLPS